MKEACVINGKIVRIAQHKPPFKDIVAWCPHCLSYGSPMGKEDHICGNCGKSDCRIYEEVLDVTSNEKEESNDTNS